MLVITCHHWMIGFGVIMLSWFSCNKAPVIYPERKDIIETVYASGKIIPENEYKLAALTSGAIIKKLVRDGDTVKKGQLLFVISHEAARKRYDAALKNYQNLVVNLSDRSPLLNDLKLTLQNAVVKHANDSITYLRYKNLWSQGIGTKNNLDNVYTSYQVSQNQKKIAEQKYYAALNDLKVSHSNAHSQLTTFDKDLQEYYIRSDRDGIVYQTYKEAGETVNINEVVALAGSPGNLVIRLAVDQQDIGKLKTGQQVLLQTDVTGNTIYEAVVSYIYPVMNEQDQTFRVDALFTKRAAPSFIHSSVEANIIVQKKDQALVLPRNALTSDNSVWIQVNRTAKKTAVQTGITTLDHVEIIAGLNEGTAVLLTSQNDEP
ncbi:HlyD family efflux transporter periplasmic adaptor subunit [Niastella caeni]|uniref:HlyD family efflux transporter periplasmic adaptor subunit n=1 Tax=Niastella caeni TaxID=2569763 RepID=A0A4S8HVB0_9BACT|nr:HlyD family efflux transporter periplasmic adaptor subunit [Niastella caeni]THU39563.1 HlyD family efflux transporter periplasmic adaptor subunit [Niastella caeni]